MLTVVSNVARLYMLAPARTNSFLEFQDLVAHNHPYTSLFSYASLSLSPSTCNMSTLATLYARLGHTSASKMQHISLSNNVPSTLLVISVQWQKCTEYHSIEVLYILLTLFISFIWTYGALIRFLIFVVLIFFLIIVVNFARNSWTQLL